MMLNFRTRAIIKREVKQQIFSKRFIFTTIALPFFLILVFGLQFLFLTLEDDTQGRLLILSDQQETLNSVQLVIENDENSLVENFSLEFRLSDAENLQQTIEQQRSDILSGEISGLLYIPAQALEDKRIGFYSNNAGNQLLLDGLRRLVNEAIVSQFVAELGINVSDADFIAQPVRIENNRVTETGNLQSSNGGQQLVAVSFTFLLYFSLLLISAPAMAAVNEEKVGRVVEIVLASVSASELMAGKIIGSAIAGFTQILIWFIPLFLIISGSLPVMIALIDFEIQLGLLVIIYFMLNYIIGVLTFLSIFSAFGAMFDNPQDAQSSLFPIMLLVIIPFILAFTVVNNPASIIGQVSSMLPFASILVMPARMVLIDIPFWQFLVAIAVNILTLFVVILISGKIYRLTILLSGKRPGWKEVWKWLRYT